MGVEPITWRMIRRSSTLNLHMGDENQLRTMGSQWMDTWFWQPWVDRFRLYSPIPAVCFGPLPNGPFLAEIHGGDPNDPYIHWHDPPSTPLKINGWNPKIAAF